jgi:uncharacterized membrane protein YdjX (TVP38/TMEM64 family)
MTATNPSQPPTNKSNQQSSRATGPLLHKIIITAIVAIVFATTLYFSKSWLSLEGLAAHETKLQSLLDANLALVLSIAFLIYVAVTALSIPGATALSLIYAWFFKFWTALALISFASTAGATCAFLISRYLLRDWVQHKFGQRFEQINRSFDDEGAFYLFTMRLIPVFPFFLVNLLMGLTSIKTTTFWWISQIGMLAGTIVYVYAGATIPDLNTLQNKGIAAAFSSTQLTNFTIAAVLLGIFPIVAKRIFVPLVQKMKSKPS